MSTTTTSLASIVPPEDIEDMFAGANLAAPTALQIADAKPVEPGKGSTASLPRMNAVVVPAGTKAENAEMPIVTAGMSDETINDGDVGYGFRISRKATRDAIRNSVRDHIQNFAEFLLERIDSDGLSQFPSATAVGSHSGVDVSDQLILTDLAVFHALKPRGRQKGVFISLSTIGIRDWTLDLQANGGTYLGGDAESARVASLMSPMSGFKGMRHGLAIFMSEQLSTSGTDFVGAIGVMRQSLAYRVWETLTVEEEYRARRKAWEVFVSARYGWGLRNPDNDIIRLVYDNAA
jgi:hypothetical protein